MRDSSNTPNPSLAPSLLEGWRAYWQHMKPREKRWVMVAGAVLAAALLWWVALAPALKILRQAPAQHRSLDAQIQTMQSMSREAKTLQSQPKLGLEEAQKALQNSVTQRFGTTGQVSLNGERATVTLKNASPRELALWLTQARVNARALPSDVKLVRSTVTGGAANANANAGAGTGWDGTLVMDLPKK